MNYALFIDDERDPPDDGRNWIIARSSVAAVQAVYNHGMPHFISFDHDLGGEDTSLAFIGWLFDYTLDTYGWGVPASGLQFPRDFYIHSQNPVGAENIRAKMEGFKRHLEELSCR